MVMLNAVSATRQGGSVPGAQPPGRDPFPILDDQGTHQYFYDGVGNRLKTINNGVTTKYIYDARGNLLAEANASNAITKYYIYGAGLLAMVKNNNVYTYHHNAIGSTVAITNNKVTINAYSYTPLRANCRPERNDTPTV